MNLEYLKTYIELIETGSFSKVAKKLSISQPAVSFQIQKLEHDLGARLINRRQKNISMTDAGKRLLSFARAVADETNFLLNDLDTLRQEVTGELSIVASTIPSEFLLPPILSEFLNLHPAVRARIETSNSLTIIEGIQNGNIEIGFCGVSPPPDNQLESFKISGDEIVPIVFSGHPLAAKKQISFSDLEDEFLIFREATSGTHKSLESLLSSAGFNMRQLIPRLVLGNTHSIVSAVEAGAGIAFVSTLAIQRSLELGLICQLKLEKLELKRDFFCIHRKEAALSRLLKEFVAFVQTKVPVD